MRRIAIAWFVLSAILTPIVVAVIAPTLPPGDASSAAAGPALRRHRPFRDRDPDRGRDHSSTSSTPCSSSGAGESGRGRRRDSRQPRVHIPWLVGTTVIVLFLATFGTVELADAGAGGGEGPEPAFKPSGRRVAGPGDRPAMGVHLPLPDLRRRRDRHLELPVGQQVEFHVTSLDVIHSFWAPELGVKADANPGVDNIAFVETEGTGPSKSTAPSSAASGTATCSTPARWSATAPFTNGSRNSRRVFAPATKVLPKYATHYFPNLRGGVDERRSSYQAALAAPDRFQPPRRDRPGVVGFYFGWWLGHQIHAESLDFFDDTNQNDVALMLGYLFSVIGFLAGLGFLNYPLSRMLGAPASHAEKEEGGRRPLLHPLHRPQGRRDPVPDRHRLLLLHRRDERDADPGRAAAALTAALRGRQLPDPGRPARHDDDGDHDLGRSSARSPTTSCR